MLFWTGDPPSGREASQQRASLGPDWTDPDALDLDPVVERQEDAFDSSPQAVVSPRPWPFCFAVARRRALRRLFPFRQVCPLTLTSRSRLSLDAPGLISLACVATQNRNTVNTKFLPFGNLPEPPFLPIKISSPMEILLLILLGIPAIYAISLSVTGLSEGTREGALTGIAGASFLGLSVVPIVFYLI